ncbi:exosortase A [Azohydromonas australica]|uniref:exosortase A n=1 Tax=Azohydromonas australica TaxID=364039 RepID=UPI0006858EF9|nr:exosortase A [Azohydromonas australica]
MPMPPQAHPGWPRALAALALLLAALLWLYRDTALGMVGIWLRSETFTHAFTVPPISLWLIWRRRAQLAQLAPRPVPWLLLPMAAVALAWLMGHLVAVNAVTQFALVTLLVLSVPAVLGWQVAGAIRFPLLFLYFAVPFGEFLMPQLMDWTADFTVWALQRSGIPVLRDGLQFTIPTGHWSVEAACSGIRYLMASLMVGVLFAYLNYSSMLRRWVFVGVSILVPILANWVRAYLIVLVGHLSGNELATGADHLVYGWVFFGVVILLMLAVGAMWSQPEAELAAEAPAAGRPGRAAALAPLSAAVLALGVLALPHGLLARVGSMARPMLSNLDAVGTPAAGWSLAAQPPADWRHAYLNPTQRLERNYARGEQRVGLQMAYYAAETSDSKLVSSSNALVQGRLGPWALVGQDRREMQLPDRSLTWRTAELRSGNADAKDSSATRLVVWRAYWINGVLTTASDFQAKALLALNQLLGRGGDGAVLMLYAVKAGPGQAEAVLEAFAREHLSALDEQLRRARDAAP